MRLLEVHVVCLDWTSELVIGLLEDLGVQDKFLMTSLQLMKATVLADRYDILSIFIVICLIQRCLLTVARYCSLSFLLTYLLSFYLSRFSFYIMKSLKNKGANQFRYCIDECQNEDGRLTKGGVFEDSGRKVREMLFIEKDMLTDE